MEMITVEEVKNRLEKGEDFCFIDVREVWEYEEDNIGAQNIPLAEIPNKLDELAELKEQEIVIHCKSGNRASQAQMYLKQQGFNSVINMSGGIEAFREAGY
ncbi:rhodanese-like domain-containing protein [Roseivirga sp.]|uniref:rhodanese-like domain-containing protein n=1 Tax=Roseivirga sp. TaxID=1964215 RepID=UPI003B51F97A